MKLGRHIIIASILAAAAAVSYAGPGGGGSSAGGSTGGGGSVGSAISGGGRGGFSSGGARGSVRGGTIERGGSGNPATNIQFSNPASNALQGRSPNTALPVIQGNGVNRSGTSTNTNAGARSGAVTRFSSGDGAAGSFSRRSANNTQQGAGSMVFNGQRVRSDGRAGDSSFNSSRSNTTFRFGNRNGNDRNGNGRNGNWRGTDWRNGPWNSDWTRHHGPHDRFTSRDVDWRYIDNSAYRRWVYARCYNRYYPYPLGAVYVGSYFSDYYPVANVVTYDSDASYGVSAAPITSNDTGDTSDIDDRPRTIRDEEQQADEDRGKWVPGHYAEVPTEDVIEGETVDVYHPAVYRKLADGKLEKVEASSTSKEPKIRIILTKKWIEGHYANEAPETAYSPEAADRPDRTDTDRDSEKPQPRKVTPVMPQSDEQE